MIGEGLLARSRCVWEALVDTACCPFVALLPRAKRPLREATGIGRHVGGGLAPCRIV
jgi:hypothetical protein